MSCFIGGEVCFLSAFVIEILNGYHFKVLPSTFQTLSHYDFSTYVIYDTKTLRTCHKILRIIGLIYS